MIPDSDEYYYHQWCGRMRWACVRNATGRDCNWVLARSSGRIVPGRAESWGAISKHPHSIANLVSCLIIEEFLSCK
jgi:hypothetical protein